MSTLGVAEAGLSFDEEAELIRLAKQQDAYAWATLHDRFYPLIFKYAYSRLSQREDAEDVASQVFLEAVRSIGRYEDRGRPILAWFYGIAGNIVSRQFRDAKQRQNTGSLTDVDDLAGAQSEDELIESTLLKQALKKLKPEHAEILILRFSVGLPTKQVAALIGKSEAATYSLQVRAAEALRRELAA